MLRAIRIAALAAIAVVLLLPPAGSAGRNSGVKRVSSLDSALAVQVNAFRVAHGLVSLRVSPFLAAAARAHSTQMARLGYFSHNSANGSSFSSRIATYYPARGYRSWTVGENLLWASPDVGAPRALKLWLSSPPTSAPDPASYRRYAFPRRARSSVEERRPSKPLVGGSNPSGRMMMVRIGAAGEPARRWDLSSV